MAGETDEEREVEAREEAEPASESSLEFLVEDVVLVRGPVAVREANSVWAAVEDIMRETGRDAAKTSFE